MKIVDRIGLRENRLTNGAGNKASTRGLLDIENEFAIFVIFTEHALSISRFSPLLPLARLPAALLRRLPVLRDHERPAQAAEGPRCRQGFEVHAQPASRETGLQRA